MRTSDGWEDYEIIATGDGKKLERWGEYRLLRPEPQAIWRARREMEGEADAVYVRSPSGGGHWEYARPVPEEWEVGYRDLRFLVRPMGFKHTGLFPEQAANWDRVRELARSRPGARVLNLFAYTGGASVALAKEGARVTHVDAARGMVKRAGENAALSGVGEGIRYIVDDCAKFIARETRRGSRYDAVIMDPPSYGRGPRGEVWRIEDCLYDLAVSCAGLLCGEPLFFLLNGYTTGLQPGVLEDILRLATDRLEGRTESYELGLPTDEGIALPCGASAIFEGGVR